MRVSGCFKSQLLALVVASAMLAGCTINPATGKKDFTPFMSPGQEAAIGAQEHPKILQQFDGAYDDPSLQSYVTQIGGAVAEKSELSDKPFQFTVLNSPIPNAFALPGGFVYVTRGLLVLMNSEAELAGVLGHEVGHVTARHSAKRYSNAQFLNIGSTLLGAATGNSGLQKVAELGGGLYLSKYSRGQEYQSDDLGVRYMTRAGYDPYAHSRSLAAIGLYSDTQARIAGKSAQGADFFSTHPNTPDRVRRAVQKATETGVKAGAQPTHERRYLDAIDGMLYGDDLSNGFAKGQTYYRPNPGLSFTVPNGFSLGGNSQLVLAKGPNNAVIAFDGGQISSKVTTRDYLVSEWAGSVQLSSVQASRVSGMEVVSGATTVDHQSGRIVIYLAAVRYSADQIFRFQLQAPAAAPGVAEAFGATVSSVRKVAPNKIKTPAPLRVEVITLRSASSVEKVSERMQLSKNKLDYFLALNALSKGVQLKAGQRVKIVARD